MDPTGLYYYGARYYDPVTGRFTTRDKVMGDITDPQSLNRYSYCRNNPHKYTDPDGKEPVTLTVIGTAVAVGGTFGALTRLTHYAIHCAITEETITGKGIAKAGITGFLSGATTGVATVVSASPWGPAGGMVVKAVGSSVEYAAEQFIEGKPIETEGIMVSAGVGIVSSGINKIAGVPKIAELATDNQLVQTAIQVTLTDPNTRAVKAAFAQILSDPKMYLPSEPVNYPVSHKHDPWI